MIESRLCPSVIDSPAYTPKASGPLWVSVWSALVKFASSLCPKIPKIPHIVAPCDKNSGNYTNFLWLVLESAFFLSLQAYCKSVWHYYHHKLRKVARRKGRSKATLLKLISPLHKHTPPSPYQEAIACDGVCLVAVVVGVVKRVKDIAHACGKREVAVFRANAYIT